jgi:hypothetical protein
MTEYIIIVGVIGIAAISVFGLFGDTVENQIADRNRVLTIRCSVCVFCKHLLLTTIAMPIAQFRHLPIY